MQGVSRDFRSRHFWTRLGLNLFSALGLIAAGLQTFDLLEPDKIAKARFVVIATTVILSVAYAMWRAWPRQIEVSYARPTTKVRVVVGDLFDQPTNLVIGMTTSFDTEVPDIIERRSVQGQFLDREYAGAVADLDFDINAALAGVLPNGSQQKPGKQIIYPLGTVATIRKQRRHYFCTAYAQMDANNQAQSTVDGLWSSLSSLWVRVRQYSNGDPVAIPILGGGLSRLSQVLPAQDAIRLTIMSFMLASRQFPVCERLDIVVLPDQAKALDLLELQSFMRSMQ